MNVMCSKALVNLAYFANTATRARVHVLMPVRGHVQDSSYLGNVCLSGAGLDLGSTE